MVKSASVVAATTLALTGCSFVIRPTRSRAPAIVDVVIAVAATSAAIAFGVRASHDNAPDNGLLGGFADLQKTIDATGAVTFAIYAAAYGASAIYGFTTVESEPVARQ